MLRLVSTATHQGRRTKEMSFLRRILYHSRQILRNYPSLFGNGRARAGTLPEKNTSIRIEGIAPRSGTGNVNSSVSKGNFGIGEASGNSRGSTTLLSIGQQIHSQVRQLFINNVLRRATTNQEIARKATQQLLFGNSRPFFALVATGLATGSTGILTKGSEFDGICWEIRESIAKKRESSSEQSNNLTEKTATSVSDLQFGPILNQGCNAAVYAANWSDASSDEDSTNWPLAVKMLFNYDIESNAFSILKGMVKEIVPASRVDLKSLENLEMSLFNNVKRCPSHLNVINISHAFVDRVPLLSEGIEKYPSALPRRLNPNDGLGRNMSLFLIMKRYDVSLQEYLSKYSNMNFRTKLLILSQILNGVAHLERNEIAHRDLKADNILIDLCYGPERPKVVISDFGCCLADKTYGLKVPFTTFDTDRGGNVALTAPEISTAVPGSWKYLDYRKSDAWSVGAIAYEIFGNGNPFYRSSDSSDRLDSRTYTENQLPPLENANIIIQALTKKLLRRNPDQRFSAEQSLYVCMVMLWAPSQWLIGKTLPNDDDILQWLVCLTTKALCHGSDELEYSLICSFLRKINFPLLKSSVQWIVQATT